MEKIESEQRYLFNKIILVTLRETKAVSLDGGKNSGHNSIHMLKINCDLMRTRGINCGHLRSRKHMKSGFFNLINAFDVYYVLLYILYLRVIEFPF